jgi:hypothetical protein
MIALICQYLGLEIEPMVLNNQINSTTDIIHDLFEYVGNGSTDTIAMNFQATENRKSDFVFSLPLYQV